jgi:hypothetical protein
MRDSDVDRFHTLADQMGKVAKSENELLMLSAIEVLIIEVVQSRQILRATLPHLDALSRADDAPGYKDIAKAVKEILTPPMPPPPKPQII